MSTTSSFTPLVTLPLMRVSSNELRCRCSGCASVTHNTVEIKAQSILRTDYSKATVPDRSDGAAVDDESPPF